jgi:glycosyltransferase involved in cell wall biosynthesis
LNDRPLVSAIMIFLNGAEFIAEAVESIVAQTYQHWELWMVDDGSTDDSTAIARRYAQQYPDKIYYLEHESHGNRGRSASRNLAMRHMRGAYVAFLDADDLWLPAKLDQQLAILEGQPGTGIVYGPTYYWHGWTGKPDDALKDYMKDPRLRADRLYQPPEVLLRLLHDSGTIPGNCSMLVRAETVKQIGGFEDAFTSIYEDQVFFAKLCLATPIYVMGTCVARYRQHRNSSCAVAERQGIYHPERPNQARQAFLDWLDAYFHARHVTDRRLWRALRRQLRPYRRPRFHKIVHSAAVARKRCYNTGARIARYLMPTR